MEAANCSAVPAAPEEKHPVDYAGPFPVVFPDCRLVGKFGHPRARIKEGNEEHVISGGLERSEDVFLPCDSLFPSESRDDRPPVHHELVGMMPIGLDHVEDVRPEFARRVTVQSGEVDGKEEFEPGSQFLCGPVDGLSASGIVGLVVPGPAVERKAVDPRRLSFLDFPLVILHALAMGGEADHVVSKT